MSNMSIDSDNDALYEKLDVSWMNEYKRLENISADCVKDPMDKIRTYILYINRDLEIESILLESFPLILNDSNQPVIGKDVLLKFIQDKKLKNGVKYSLFDILIYNIELESENIEAYSSIDESGVLEKFGGFFRTVNFIHEIVVLPSLFIFHELNSMFILFKERDSENSKHRHTMKSILKKADNDGNLDKNNAMGGGGGGAVNLHSNTKKVRIVLPNEKPMKLSDKSKTRKQV